MKDLMADRVRVQIFGREYEMDPGGLTPLELQSLARFVDDKMREISNRFNIVDTQKIAVLAALNISLDYLQMKEKGLTEETGLTPKLEHLSRLLDKALETA